MKVRSYIFFLVIALGLLPLFILVSLNLPRTVSRFESAARLESQALSAASLTRLNARISCINKSLLRTATLPYTHQLLQTGTQQAPLEQTLSAWFSDDLQVSSIRLYSAGAELKLAMDRSGDQGPLHHLELLDVQLQAAVSASRSLVLPGEVHPQLLESEQLPPHLSGHQDYLLMMSTQVVDSQGQSIGVVAMLVNLSRFLDDYRDSIWANFAGLPFYGCGAGGEVSCQLTARPPDISVVNTAGNNRQPRFSAMDADQQRTAWLPLFFGTESTPVIWVGSPVDESSIHRWKRSLLVNVLTIVGLMTMMVFALAGGISRRIEDWRQELLSGLNTIMSQELPVAFHWRGPRELQDLGAELSTLSQRFALVAEERNQAQRISRESEERFRGLADSARDAILLIDSMGRLVYLNGAALELFGFSETQVLGQEIEQWLQLQPLDPEVSLVQLVSESVLYRSGHGLECSLIDTLGRQIPVELALSSATIMAQWYGIWIIRDLSERKKSEQLAIRQQQELLQADKMISLGLLVSGVAHEINNPNSISLLNLPLLARSWESIRPVLDEYYGDYGDFTVAGIDYSEMREQLPRIHGELAESAARIRQIVQDLKDYARQESSESFERIQLNQVVESAIRLTTSSINRASCAFEVHYGSGLPLILGNRQRLVQVAINLIQNSCEALAVPGQKMIITTRSQRQPAMVELEVFDQGSGIREELLKQITDPFFTTKRAQGGTGLGLSVSLAIVQQHHGTLSFASSEGEWTRVTLRLPVASVS
ncbi:two-component system sensor histidine kinase NtrB [Desulfogranum mediterraneum]|uniref:two-component system sensor histidine kinase NtrB n=1 Tax=Desulfogranum mediterraneum TaxID=160661 RepID=UPI000427430A|nr:ATP-binding protein [Desulfogranum mediterraneum]